MLAEERAGQDLPSRSPSVASLTTLSPVVRQHFCTMADLATLLLQHSTLSDIDLSHLVGMQTKMARKICGRLKEDGLVTIQQRTERRTDGSGGFMSGPGNQPGKERVSHSSPVVRQHFCTMAELAALLLRTIARTFYSTEHILIIDSLIQHSAL
jgi:hypothetical protein